MRKIIWMMSVSLDGFMTGPAGELDWNLVDEELHQHLNDEIGSMGALLHGRVMYDLMAAAWPEADKDPASPPWMIEFAKIWREMPKLVFSRTLDHVDWNATIVRSVDPDEIRRLRAQPGGDLLLGGAVLADEFLRLDLIDEFRFYVHPVVIGRGRPLFPALKAHVALRLVETRTFGNGVVRLRYQHPGR
jgi:dihydrofolate reductase